MTAPGDTTNVAGDSANIGVQAGAVHGDVNMYNISPDDSPEKKFELGVRYLDGGMSRKAWELINEAFMEDHRTNRVYFYRLLATVSDKTREQLSEEEAAVLRDMHDMIHIDDDDEWAAGVRTVRRLLDSAQEPESDLRVLLAEFDKLGDTQRTLILRHMEAFLDGPIQNQMWTRALARAELEQTVGERLDRAWKFFHPSPAAPRVRAAQPPMVSRVTWVGAVMATPLLVAATVHIGYLLAQASRVAALLAYLLSVAGGYLAARYGVEWRFRTVRRRAKDQKYQTLQRRRTSSPPDGFARRVDQRFDRYFAKYMPRGVGRQTWRAETAGIRKSMRDEMVEIYRESPVGVEKIAWLIRYMVADVRRRWEDGTLWSYREELATPLTTKALTVLGAAVLAGGALWAVGGAVQASPLSAARSAVLVMAGGWVAAHTWLRVILERRRFAADTFENEQARTDRWAAFARWQAKLADKPDDTEMAAWLDCDRKVLLSEALQHYNLAMSNVIAHAFIEAPAATTAHARVRHGPWRYTNYQLLVFLLTTDGVRQLAVNLDFRKATFHDRERTNYRYEAVAAVHVVQGDDDERTFELTLVNGQEIKVQVIRPGMEELQQDETPGTVSEVTLDAAGLRRTLHILEGVAAEGKGWIRHGYPNGKARSKNFTFATQDGDSR